MNISTENLLLSLGSALKTESLDITLSLLSDEINYLILRIKLCEDIKDAQVYFNELDKIQLGLSKAYYRYHIKISNGLKKFIDDYNCLHDESERKALFDQIHNESPEYQNNPDNVLLKLVSTIEDSQVKLTVAPYLEYFNKQIRRILEIIRHCHVFSLTNTYFNILEKMQLVLARFVFKDGIVVSQYLSEFIRVFDRIDDAQERKRLFDIIKDDPYFLEKSIL